MNQPHPDYCHSCRGDILKITVNMCRLGSPKDLRRQESRGNPAFATFLVRYFAPRVPDNYNLTYALIYGLTLDELFSRY